MALVNHFEVWASEATSPVVKPSSDIAAITTGYLAGEKIYANIFNGILKDVSLVTASLLVALLETTSADTSNMTFDNAVAKSDMINQFKALLNSRNVATATKLATARTISILDNAGGNVASTQFDGSANVSFVLPTSLAINIVGNATTANTCGWANNATNATNAENANHATSADSATNAGHATSADSATSASSSVTAERFDMHAEQMDGGTASNPCYIDVDGIVHPSDWDSTMYYQSQAVTNLFGSRIYYNSTSLKNKTFAVTLSGLNAATVVRTVVNVFFYIKPYASGTQTLFMNFQFYFNSKNSASTDSVYSANHFHYHYVGTDVYYKLKYDRIVGSDTVTFTLQYSSSLNGTYTDIANDEYILDYLIFNYVY